MKRQWNWLVLLVLLSGTACELDLSQATGAAPVDPGTLTTQADCEAAGFTWQEDSAAEKCVEPCATASDCTDEERPFCRNIGLFAGGDDECNISALVCTADEQDECI